LFDGSLRLSTTLLLLPSIVENATWIALNNNWLFLLVFVSIIMLSQQVIRCAIRSRLVIYSSACYDVSIVAIIATLITLEAQASLEVLILQAAPGRLWLLVELNRFATSGALNLLDEPGSQANQVEDVLAAKLLAFLDVAQADAALVGRCVFILFGDHVLQLL